MNARNCLILVLSISIGMGPQSANAGWWDSAWQSTKSGVNSAAAATSNAWDSTKATTANAWEGTKAGYNSAAAATVNAWDGTKSGYNTAVTATSDAWQVTKTTTANAWEGTKTGYNASTTWVSEHKGEIAATGAAMVFTAAAYYFNKGSSPQTANYRGTDGANVAPGRPFSLAQKQMLRQQNAAQNGGVLRSDLSGIPLVAPQRHVKGYVPPLNEAHVDHVIPRSAGGANSFSNAQILSRQENLLKGGK